jgi:MYXO-CTERM domain-containing protein
MPGATELVVDPSDPKHVLVRATFGLVQSYDDGAGWRWVCEQAIHVSGEYDPPMAVVADGSLVLLPPLADAGRGLPVGGALVSRDRGCTWSPAPAPLLGKRAVDLTVDPRDRAHALVILSGVESISQVGQVTFYNVLAETRDDAKTWATLGALPSDFAAETVEIAPSDPKRVYVSGTASADPMLGVLERSEDGGKTWRRASHRLPQGSGSMYIGAVDPRNPDRLWARVPARADTFGFNPAGLLMSRDKGASWTTLATTQHGMFGFALSPDGATLAFGSPRDGLWIGPSDGSGAFQDVSRVQVRCLRWDTTGLYACGTEPADPFSVGLSTDHGASFRPIYTIAETCPQVCADDAQFATTCRAPWATIGPFIRASGTTCSVPWARVASRVDPGRADGGAHPGAEGGSGDGLTQPGDAGIRRGVTDSCSCRAAPGGFARGWIAAWAALALSLAARRSRRRRS